MACSAAWGQEVSGEQSREAPLLKIEPNQDRVQESSCKSDASGETADAFHSAGKTAVQDQRSPAAVVTCLDPRTTGDARSSATADGIASGGAMLHVTFAASSLRGQSET